MKISADKLLSRTTVPCFLIGSGILLLCFAHSMGITWGSFTLTLLAASFTNIGLWLATNQIERRYVGVKFLSLAHVLQAPGAFVCALFVGPRLREEHPFPVLVDHPLETYLGLCAIPAGILSAVIIRGLFSRQPKKNYSLHSYLDVVDAQFGVFLLFAAVFYIAFIYSTESLSGPIQYILRILFYATSFCSYAAGYLGKRFPKVALTWGIGIAVYFIYASITGGRGLAFIFGGLFTLGFVFSLNTWSRRLNASLKIGLPVLLVFLFFSAIIGETRVIVGRGGWDKIRDFDLATYKMAALQVIDNFGVKADPAAEAGIVGSGMMRLVQWCNVTVPAMSPEIVPYRGFGDLGGEISSLFRLGVVSGRTYWANLLSNDYGFYTAEDGSSAVEFGLISDSWSRGGGGAALAYGFCAAYFFVGVEAVVMILFRKHRALKALLLLVIVNLAIFTFVRESFLTCSRLLILYLAITAIAFGLVEIIHHRLRGIRAFTVTLSVL